MQVYTLTFTLGSFISIDMKSSIVLSFQWLCGTIKPKSLNYRIFSHLKFKKAHYSAPGKSSRRVAPPVELRYHNLSPRGYHVAANTPDGVL